MRESMIPARTLLRIAFFTLVLSYLGVAGLVWNTPGHEVSDPPSDPVSAPADPSSPPPSTADVSSTPTPEPTPDPTPAPSPSETPPPPSPEASPPPASQDLRAALETAGAGASSRSGGPRITYNREVEPLRTLWSLFLPVPVVWMGGILVAGRLAVLIWRRRR